MARKDLRGGMLTEARVLSPVASSGTGGERWRGSGDRRGWWSSGRRAEECGELGGGVEVVDCVQ
jgi:hypothetical protein